MHVGDNVASTLQAGLVDTAQLPSQLALAVGMMAVLASAFAWVTLCTYFSLPVSSTHATVGAVFAFALARAGGAKVREHRRLGSHVWHQFGG